MFIVNEKLSGDVQVIEQVKNGAPADKVDLVIVGEGYTAAEREKFKQDLAALQ